MSLEKILELTNATPMGSFGSFVGHCPIHGDKKKSLSIKKTSDDKILIKCHANCSQESIISYFIEQKAWGNSKTSVQSEYHEQARSLWNDSKEITVNDIAANYLNHRGLFLNAFPTSLRLSSKCYNTEFKTNVDALIARIQNSNNEFIGIQRIYLNKDGRKLNAEAPKMTLGGVSGGYVEFKSDSTEGVIHLTEGIETGLAIFLSLNETTYCAVNAGNLSKVETDKTVKTIHIWGDKDVSEAGQREALKAAEEFKARGLTAIVHFPKDEISEGSKSIDFLDVYLKKNNEIIEERKSGLVFKNGILPIKCPSYDLPKIDQQYLPYIIRDWVFGQAQRLNVSPETIVVPLLTIIGSIIGRKVALRPKQNDDWTVYGNLWGILIAPPGTKKTPILDSSIKILNKIEYEENLKNQEQIREFADEKKELDIRIDGLEKQLKDAIKEEDQDKKSTTRKTLSDLKKRAKELEVFSKRYSTSAFSLEKLFELLKENTNGMLISNDEISGLFESFKKKGQETTRAFLLQGWNGNGSFRYDILSRPSVSLDAICITLLGGTQPSVINKMLRDMRQDQNNDGFIQRFQLIAYPNQDITPEFVDIGLSSDLQKKVEKLIAEICNLDGSRFGEKHFDNDSYIAKLTPEAYELFAAYMDRIEKEVHQSENGGYKNHISKFDGHPKS